MNGSVDGQLLMIAWNANLTLRDGGGWTHKELLTPIFAAISERWALADPLDVRFSSAFKTSASTPGPVGNRILGPLVATFTEGNWRSARDNCLALAEMFAKQKKSDGLEYVPPLNRGWASALKCYPGSDLDGSTGYLPFPYPNGWERHFPREIYTLSYAGLVGQRARFVVYLGGTWRSERFGVSPFGGGVTTPSGERVNAGKFFDHNGTAWVLSADQVSGPDEVIEFLGSAYMAAVNLGTGIFPGDYFGPWIRNDTRDALNQLTKLGAPYSQDGFFAVESVFLSGQGPSYTWYYWANYKKWRTWWDSEGGSNYRGIGGQASVDDAYTAYAGVAATVGSQHHRPGMVLNGGSFFALGHSPALSTYSAATIASKPRLTANNPASGLPTTQTAISNPGGYTPEISFWNTTGELFSPYTHDGLDIVTGDWQEVSPRITDINGIGGWFGYEFGTKPTRIPSNANGERGWLSGQMIAILDYGLASGGLAYTTFKPD